MNKHVLEVGLYRTMKGLLRVLPETPAFAMAEGLALFAHRVCGWRRESTRMRLEQVFPGKSEQERKAIRLEAVRNLARNFVELVRMPSDAGSRVTGIDETFEAFRAAREKGKGILLVIAHTGNWDLAGGLTSEEGFPMCFIARKQKNSVIYNELLEAREKGGGQVIDRDDPKLMRKVLTFLAENGIVAILVDIRARKPDNAWSFLGQDAWLSNGLGLLAAKSGAEVVTVHLRREGRKRHVWKPFPAQRLADPKDKAVRDVMLQTCLDQLGGECLRYPESYFWFNKRWVLEPHQADAGKKG
jgi:KDO2-lipid IV(A) lauroyltransferase